MKSILLVCGEGGHYAQMKRLAQMLRLEQLGVGKVLVLSDSEKCLIGDFQTIVIPPMGIKSKRWLWQSLPAFAWSISVAFLACLKVIRADNVKVVISTGPGLGFVPAIFVKLRGGVVIHIETWSRFHTSSAAGRLMHFLSDRFYVQNEEQLGRYKRAIFSGRL